ncbi:biotin--[acetyl-CoA-carboxylase] ligase [Croceicoccus sp. F390]|uniref:biotin--[biotin carboxyl-carrier protein] ligase n=1 Tax=Croceicoccus esteveae TaxID=3075597 RepID=A0ABU2ZFX2_9SPHN|nr:biotin--[acetyl-CoA-carboxylase] ligase [Croceicoccus sp. F390]MDT0575498.1 biotin--[acetyl-CoA-carboxylase] ligase [Croceicoccus sp. F390]
MAAAPVLEIVGSIGSTNAEMLDRLRSAEQPVENHWLIADRQTAGRGRLGREWHDGAGNFMGSTAIVREPADPPMQTLALVVGIAVFDAVASLVPCSDGLALKWPNDLHWRGAKLAGILVQASDNVAIVGVGINLRTAPSLPDRRTAALVEIGGTGDRDLVARTVAVQVARQVLVWRRSGFAAMTDAWLERGPAAQTPIIVSEASGNGVVSAGTGTSAGTTGTTGLFHGVAPDGALLLQMPDGTVRAVHSGEIEEGR